MRRSVALGISLCIVILVIAGVAFVVFAPEMFKWAQRQMVEEQERGQIAANWQPPAKEAVLDQLFPANVGGYKLDSRDDKAAIPEFRFDMSGLHGVYHSAASQMDVFAYQVSALEKEALFRRLEEAFEKDEGRARINKTDFRYSYWSAKRHQNHFWWMKGWLFVFRTRDSEDREAFVKTYLQETSARGEHQYSVLTPDNSAQRGRRNGPHVSAGRVTRHEERLQEEIAGSHRPCIRSSFQSSAAARSRSAASFTKGSLAR